MEFRKEYLDAFHIIPFTDVPDSLPERYFRIDAGGADPETDDPFFAVFSKNSFLRVLKAGYEPVLLIAKNHTKYTYLMETVRADCPKLPVCLIPCEGGSADCPGGAVYGFDRFGLSALFRKKPLPPLSVILRPAKKVAVFRGFGHTEKELQELGPQIRSAVALGADAVLLQAGMVDPFDRFLVRITLGTHFLLPFALYESDEELFRALDENGFSRVLIFPGKTEGASLLADTDIRSSRIALISDHSIQKGQAPDPALSFDTGVYVRSRPFPGKAPCLTSIALYSLFSKDLT